MYRLVWIDDNLNLVYLDFAFNKNFSICLMRSDENVKLVNLIHKLFSKPLDWNQLTNLSESLEDGKKILERIQLS